MKFIHSSDALPMNVTFEFGKENEKVVESFEIAFRRDEPVKVQAHHFCHEIDIMAEMVVVWDFPHLGRYVLVDPERHSFQPGPTDFNQRPSVLANIKCPTKDSNRMQVWVNGHDLTSLPIEGEEIGVDRLDIDMKGGYEIEAFCAMSLPFDLSKRPEVIAVRLTDRIFHFVHTGTQVIEAK